MSTRDAIKGRRVKSFGGEKVDEKLDQLAQQIKLEMETSPTPNEEIAEEAKQHVHDDPPPQSQLIVPNENVVNFIVGTYVAFKGKGLDTDAAAILTQAYVLVEFMASMKNS